MDTVIVVLQILCVAGLALGTGLSLHRLVLGSNESSDCTVANDVEPAPAASRATAPKN